MSLCFSVLLDMWLPRLGTKELFCVFFVRLFVLRVFICVSFIFILVSGIGCDLWLWHSLDFSFYFILRSSNSVSFKQSVQGSRCSLLQVLKKLVVYRHKYRHSHLSSRMILIGISCFNNYLLLYSNIVMSIDNDNTGYTSIIPTYSNHNSERQFYTSLWATSKIQTSVRTNRPEQTMQILVKCHSKRSRLIWITR